MKKLSTFVWDEKVANWLKQCRYVTLVWQNHVMPHAACPVVPLQFFRGSVALVSIALARTSSLLIRHLLHTVSMSVWYNLCPFMLRADLSRQFVSTKLHPDCLSQKIKNKKFALLDHMRIEGKITWRDDTRLNSMTVILPPSNLTYINGHQEGLRERT